MITMNHKHKDLTHVKCSVCTKSINLKRKSWYNIEHDFLDPNEIIGYTCSDKCHKEFESKPYFYSILYFG